MPKSNFFVSHRLFKLSATIFVALATASLIFFVFQKFITKEASAAWFDDTYTYRLKFNFIHNAAVNDSRSITFTLDTAELITANLMQSDCDDLRFTDGSGKALNHDITGTCNNASTTVEVIFPNIVDGTNVGYVYYANPAAVNAEINSALYSDLSPSGGAPSNTTPTSSDEQGTAPISYWSMDEGQGSTLNDYSPGANNDLTISNALWRTQDMCVSGNCLYFDGNADRATKTYSSDTELLPSTNSFSISAWFKHNSIAGSDTMISRTDGVNGVGWKIYMDSSGYMCFGIDDTAGTFPSDSACSTTSYADSQWHHITGVKSGTSSITLYIDGKQIAQDSSITGSSLDGTSAGFRIGNDADEGTNGWTGFIDEIKYYNFAKTNTQVIADSNSQSNKPVSATLGSGIANQTTLTNNLLGYWKMDENTGSSITDLSANGITGTLVNTPTWTSGKYGPGLSFAAASSEYVNLALPAPIASQAFTISAWINPSSLAAERAIYGSSSNNFLFNVNTTGTLILCNDNGGVCSNTASSSTGVITTNSWQHVVVTHNGSGTYAFFVNGRNVTSDATGDFASNNSNMYIGRSNSFYFEGSIDEVKVYNRTLSNKEVDSLFGSAPYPVGWWKLDDNAGVIAADSSGSGYSADLNNGPVWRTAKMGSGLRFDGTDDYASTSSNSVLDTSGPFTISLWAYPLSDGEGGFGALLGKSGNISIYQATNDSIEVCQEGASCAATVAYSGNNALVNNRWSHIVVTHNGSGSYNFYSNGTLTNGVDISGPDTNTSQPLIFGGSSTSSPFNYNGLLDDVKIYNYVRTSIQIIEDMNGGHPAGGSPVGSYVARWKFDDLSGTIAQDQTYNNNDLTLNTASWAKSGKYDGAWNGTGGAIRLSRSDDPDLDFSASEDFTISAWFKSDSATTPTAANQWLAHKRTSDAAAAIGYATYFNSSGQYCLGIDDDAVTNFPEDLTCSTSNLFDMTWHHLVAVKTDTSRLEIFVDGKSQSTPDTSMSATGSLENNGALYIGDQDADDNATANAEELHGDLDDVKIYRSALSQTEILIDFNANSVIALGSIAENEDEVFSMPNPIASWRLDENTGTTVADSSGNNYNLGLVGPLTWVKGKFGQALRFNGDDTAVDALTDPISEVGAYSISFWVYPNTLTGDDTFFSHYNNNWSIFYELGSIHLCGDTACANIASSNTSVLTTNTWNHVVVTYDGNGTAYFYINGVNQTLDSSTDESNFTDSFIIGAYDGNPSYINSIDGVMDEIYVFDSALTHTQIAYLLNRGKPLAHYKFDECSGSTAYNTAPSASGGAPGLNGTVVPVSSGNTSVGSCSSGTSTEMWDDGSSGKFNSSLGFDGVDDYVTVGNSGELQFNTSFSVSAWVKPNFSSPSSYYTVVSKWNGASRSDQGFQLTIGNATNPIPQFGVGISGGYNGVSATSSLTNGNWYHVMGTYDSSNNTIRVFVNGMLENSYTLASGMGLNSTDPLRIGSTSDVSAQWFEGQIDDVRIYGYRVPDAMVKIIANEGSAQRFAP